jgi:Ser/Thr protein kinase RdoA (MazF antagonist)
MNSGEAQNQAFKELDPVSLLDAVDSVGIVTDGRALALNSYENRVYQVGVEDSEPLIAKFYRPGRWRDESILEEHAYTIELAQHELPIVAPLEFNGETMHRYAEYRFALYPRRGGRSPDLGNEDQLAQLGRFAARIHNVGAREQFQHRPAVDVESYCLTPSRYLIDNGLVPSECLQSYREVVDALVDIVRECEGRAGDVATIRLHGDFHLGNILWRDDTPHIVDFDDARNGPAIQDLWMFLPGERAEQTNALQWVLEGYTQFRDFNARELHLLEAMRTLRLIYFTAWVGRRWDDPAFPPAFPWFASQGWWREHLQALHEQVQAMQSPPLSWGAG